MSVQSGVVFSVMNQLYRFVRQKATFKIKYLFIVLFETLSHICLCLKKMVFHGIMI